MELGINSTSQLSLITSVRIVCLNHYMAKPIVGLDAHYSEFRCSAVWQVPVLRVFGTREDGQKLCLHVHGVFPYLYIPDDSKDTKDSNPLAYKIATSLDKAINISLGQSNAATQHVFKICQVKGIPFYGFHEKTHQFFKIFFYNPYFVRRAANLLESGAIMNKVYQPYESHVPFNLQFMIDHNVYGMSYLHIPSQAIYYRQAKEDDSLSNINSAKILDTKIKKNTYAEYELDVSAAFIINRLQMSDQDTSDCLNPGIASIWSDERVRRSRMDTTQISPLEIPVSQERPVATITDNERINLGILNERLSQVDSQDLNATNYINQPSEKKKSKFDLNAVIANMVYPAEVSDSTQSSLMLDASFIQTHSTNANVKIPVTDFKENDSNVSIVDKNIIQNLSQRWNCDNSLSAEDHETLEVMRQLEEEATGGIDNDSILAPLTQAKMPELSQKSNSNATKFDMTLYETDLTVDNVDIQPEITSASMLSDSDDDLLNEFSMAFDDKAQFVKSKSASPSSKASSKSKIDNIVQMDGAFNSPQKNETPIKRRSKRLTRQNSSSLLKRKSVYAPLDVEYVKSPNDGISIFTQNEPTHHCKSTKKLSGTYSTRLQEGTLKNDIVIHGSAQCNPLNLACAIKLIRIDLSEFVEQSGEVKNSKLMEQLLNGLNLEHLKIIKNSPRVLLTRLSREHYDDANANILSAKTVVRSLWTSNASQKQSGVCDDDSSVLDVAREYDKRNRFYPEPGPSTVNYYKLMNLSKYNQCSSMIAAKPKKHSPTSKTSNTSCHTSPITHESNNILCESFYDQSMVFHSPSVHDDSFVVTNGNLHRTLLNSTALCLEIAPKLNAINKLLMTRGTHSSCNENVANESLIVLTPAYLPPSLKSAERSPHKFSIPEVCAPEPFYSNNSDITGRREIGQTTLYIPGDSLNDCKQFRSSLTKTCSINALRFDRYSNTKNLEFQSTQSLNNPTAEIVRDQSNIGSENDIRNIIKVREFFATGKKVTITPHLKPPTRKDALVWLKVRSKVLRGMNQFSEANPSESPLKIRREKVKTVIENAINNYDIRDDDNNAMQTISATALTPDNLIKLNKFRQKLFSASEFISVDLSPDFNRSSGSINSTVIEKKNELTPAAAISTTSSQSYSERRRNKRARFSLSQKFNKLCKNKLRISIESLPKLSIDSHSEANLQYEADIPCGQFITEKLSQNSLSSNQSSENESISLSASKLLGKTAFVRDLNLGNDHKFNGDDFNATLHNSNDFKMDLKNFQNANANEEFNYLTIFSLELHVQTRDQLNPDPEFDSISAIFYAIRNNVPASSKFPQHESGMIVVQPDGATQPINTNSSAVCVTYVDNETASLVKLINLIKIWDPDILAGYEIEMSSWGYAIQRGSALNINIPAELSRIIISKPETLATKFSEDENDCELADYQSELKIPGRILLDVWRLLRHEIALMSYTFENVMYHIMHRRYAKHSFEELMKLWNKSSTQWIVQDYYQDRVHGTMELLDHLDLIGRTCELAKLFGIQFYEVMSRGSQFRVESMMLRMAKPSNLVPISPSVQQRARMRAPEYLPLILEPQSRYYADPVIVLDFQSLYPSMIIAYNYCFSTCLGRIEHLGQSTAFEFGAFQLRVPHTLLKRLIAQNQITISPCGVAFVKSSVREGVLPRMLKEILNTRLMVKQSMKIHKTNKVLQRVLHSRQLGLKLIANVTYGYTAANFSGRMPSVEVADSVVSKGRETLERAIRMVNANTNWHAKVVYGDTDSMFVLVSGRSRDDAFEIGRQIAAAVTEDNPQPVKLKLEKVYQPCLLQTKKRYVGFMYESPEQKEPIYEAKGIETVRRDGCPIVSRMLEKTLRILFETQDVSIINRYVCRNFTRLLNGTMNVQDLIFAKEFRGINNYKPGACVPALELTKKWKQKDRRSEPRRGERVPFIIVNGPPGVPLIRLVRSPHDLLSDEGLKINAIYYITKAIIPALNRCLLLIGANVNEWFANLPRAVQLTTTSIISEHVLTKKSTISQYFSSTSCVTDCGKRTKKGLCVDCKSQPQRSSISLATKIMDIERKATLVNQLCQSCCGHLHATSCISLDCPIRFVLNKSMCEIKHVDFLRTMLDEL